MPTITFNRSARREVEETFTLNGRSFAWWTEHDDDHGAPWEEVDGHGPVSGWESRDKRPGELVLTEDRRSRRFYDFAEAMRIAKRDGWDTEPYGQGTAGERARRAALADFKRLKAWCNDDWHYVGVCVQEVEDGRAVGPVESLWGIESDAGDYLRETALDLAEELAPEPDPELSAAINEPWRPEEVEHEARMVEEEETALPLQSPEEVKAFIHRIDGGGDLSLSEHEKHDLRDFMRSILMAEAETPRMIAEEIQSQREADALALVEEIARVTLNPITEAKNGRLAGFIERAREIIGG